MLGWRNRGRTQYEELLFAQGLSRADIWQLLKISKLPSTTLVKQTLRTKIRFYESFPCNELSMINTAYKEGAHCQARQRKRNATARNGAQAARIRATERLKNKCNNCRSPRNPCWDESQPKFYSRLVTQMLLGRAAWLPAAASGAQEPGKASPCSRPCRQRGGRWKPLKQKQAQNCNPQTYTDNKAPNTRVRKLSPQILVVYMQVKREFYTTSCYRMPHKSNC